MALGEDTEQQYATRELADDLLAVCNYWAKVTLSQKELGELFRWYDKHFLYGNAS